MMKMLFIVTVLQCKIEFPQIALALQLIQNLVLGRLASYNDVSSRISFLVTLVGYVETVAMARWFLVWNG